MVFASRHTAVEDDRPQPRVVSSNLLSYLRPNSHIGSATVLGRRDVPDRARSSAYATRRSFANAQESRKYLQKYSLKNANSLSVTGSLPVTIATEGR
jgi:hypothetical protein